MQIRTLLGTMFFKTNSPRTLLWVLILAFQDKKYSLWWLVLEWSDSVFSSSGAGDLTLKRQLFVLNVYI